MHPLFKMFGYGSGKCDFNMYYSRLRCLVCAYIILIRCCKHPRWFLQWGEATTFSIQVPSHVLVSSVSSLSLPPPPCLACSLWGLFLRISCFWFIKEQYNIVLRVLLNSLPKLCFSTDPTATRHSLWTVAPSACHVYDYCSEVRGPDTSWKTCSYTIQAQVQAWDFLFSHRFSGLVTTNILDLCFLTFEPDHLTIPDTPPLNLSHYTIYYTPVNNNSEASSCSNMHGYFLFSFQ